MMNRGMQNKKEETQKILKEMQKKQNKDIKKEAEEKKIKNKIDEITKETKADDETYEFEYDDIIEDE